MAMEGAKLLIIDDEVGICDLLRLEFTKNGYLVDTANDGEDGIKKIELNKYDIVITDIKMPKIDGMQALSTIKNISPETEVIIMTGYATIDNAVQAMKVGAYDFVQKPFDIEEVLILVEKALEKSELKTLLALYESSKAVFTTLKLEELFPVMINLLKDVSKADAIAFLLFDNQNQLYLAAASFSLVYYAYKDYFVSFAERILSQNQSFNAPVIVKAPFDDNSLTSGLFADSEINSLIAYPIKLKNRDMGVLVISRTKEHPEFSQSDTKNLSIFVSQIAQSIANTKLYEKLEIKIFELEAVYKQLEQVRQHMTHCNKMFSVGQAASDLAHKLDDPVSRIKDIIKAISDDTNITEELMAHLIQLQREADTCNEIVNRIRVLKSIHKTNFVEADLNTVIEEAIWLADYNFKDNNIIIGFEQGVDIPRLKIDVNQMKRVLCNLLMNAGQSFDNAHKNNNAEKNIMIKSYIENDHVNIEIDDNGIGIKPELIDKIFEPFFTTGDPGKNIGMGLSVARTIIEQHNGKIHVKSTPEKGTSFTITLPLNS